MWTSTGKVARGPTRHSAVPGRPTPTARASVVLPLRHPKNSPSFLPSIRLDHLEFKRMLKKECDTLLWLLPPKCIDEVQPVDGGYGKLFKAYAGNALDGSLLNGDNVETWESNKLTASDRRILITQWSGEAAKQIDRDIKYRRRLFEKTGWR